MVKQMKRFNNYLQDCFDAITDSSVKDAMMYSMFAKSKKVRPNLLFLTLQAYNIEKECGYPIAAALEMIHTYSLIHDDLPAMDNDDLRRGKPTCHIQFNEAIAILAGDALLTYAFEIISKSTIKPMDKVEIISYLANYSGANGMILGQIKDIESEGFNNLTKQEIDHIHIHKTAKLITLPFIFAAILANQKQDIKSWESIGTKIGLSFQIQDDILDVVGNQDMLGKRIGSDDIKDKMTYVRLFGLETAINLAKTLYQEAISEINSLSIQSEELLLYIDSLCKRNC